MLSYLLSFFNYLFNKELVDEDNDDSKEDFLAEQLMDLEETEQPFECNIYSVDSPQIPRNTVCFQRTGLITLKNGNYILIDGILYFDITCCAINLNVHDKVLYLAYKDANESIVVVRILENEGMFWGDEENVEEHSFNVIEHVIIGEVKKREERLVYMKDSDLKFCLDDVEATFIPIRGDWLELKCTVQYNEDKPSDISAAQVLRVTSFKPIRRKTKSALVTDWNGEFGICDRQIYFHKQSLQFGDVLQFGSKVMIEAIESNQGTCSWRALKVMIMDCNINLMEDKSTLANEEDVSLQIEKERGVKITHPLRFENVDFHKSPQLTVSIVNNSDLVYVLNKWIVLTKKRDSQVHIKPFLNRPIKIYPAQTFNLTITCYPKFLGNSKESLILIFNGFQSKRFIDINITEGNFFAKIDQASSSGSNRTQIENIQLMRNIRKNDNKSIVPGVRLVKPPAFIPVKMGAFTIPEKFWSIVLGDPEQTIQGPDYNKILDRIESNIPCLTQHMNISNYIDRWHALLYMEEIQVNINMRSYDIPKAFLIRYQEYLAIEISGLSERRPSLIKGDRVIVKDVWDTQCPYYEGYIHTIKGDLVLMKFNSYFHETYSGSDVSLEFHFSRGTYRRSHQAINLAISNLGPDILFPKQVFSHSPQVPIQTLDQMIWFNEKLNIGQKAAVKNILMGESRPLPYCIFGPPGTGKTITVIETILQILKHLPDSRILVATPSNSAANLITERLIQYRNAFSDTIVRLIANYLLDSENIPDLIKPYCATLDIAREETSKPKYEVRDGIQMNCQTSLIGRHRVTIGTCYCLGSLAQMGLPRGHFTHIIVDEAGQATEPEIMISLTFIDKEHGQIILAGDPMQLGPIVISKYCKEFDMDESYLSRILESFPYQKDYDAFANGYNDKLVTKLNDNYRSLEEVLRLPSKMFYDGSLVPKLDRTELWISKILGVVTDLFESTESNKGGIFVCGIKGCNARAKDSPSWYNPQEAAMVALITCKLFKKEMSVDDIGIITPYIAQIKYLRLLFDAMGLAQPKIGTVEEFQGQERLVILISTVRSTKTHLNEDIKHTLGFVKNPKRLNVALTRAQLAVMLFCNPHLLCTDPLWNEVISHSVKEDKYMGCDLPHNLKAQ